MANDAMVGGGKKRKEGEMEGRGEEMRETEREKGGGKRTGEEQRSKPPPSKRYHQVRNTPVIISQSFPRCPPADSRALYHIPPGLL